MCDLLLTSRPFRFKSLKSHQKNGRESGGSVAIAGTGKKFSLSADESSQPGWDSRLTGSNPVGNVTLLVLKSTPFLFLMSGTSIKKIATKHIHTHTINKVELKTLYCQVGIKRFKGKKQLSMVHVRFNFAV